jgi:hypothetical protein
MRISPAASGLGLGLAGGSSSTGLGLGVGLSLGGAGTSTVMSPKGPKFSTNVTSIAPCVYKGKVCVKASQQSACYVDHGAGHKHASATRVHGLCRTFSALLRRSIHFRPRPRSRPCASLALLAATTTSNSRATPFMLPHNFPFGYWR